MTFFSFSGEKTVALQHLSGFTDIRTNYVILISSRVIWISRFLYS